LKEIGGIFMIEKLLQNVTDAMMPYLNKDQMEKLQDELYINFHGIEVKEECYELQPSNISGNEYKLKMFIASKKAINCQDGTLKHYAMEIRNVLDFLGKDIEDIKAMDLRYYFGYMREKRGIKMTTLETRMHYLSSFWAFLNTEELVYSNPVRKVGKIKVEKIIKKPFTAKELEALRGKCNNLRDRALVEFLYSTGVRISECCALNVGDINMERSDLIVYGKGSKERRTYLTEAAKYHLERYLESRCINENLTIEKLRELPLFVSNNKLHERLTKSGIQYMLRILGKKAGVKNVHPHRFRRTIATDLLNRDMPIEQVKEFLGHEKLDTTMIYCTVREENVRMSHRKFA
jgi:site-specific recombinase XerD